MNRLALDHQLDRSGACAELLNRAQRELGAFFRAVTELFGPEQAELSAEEWLHEVGSTETLPASTREWRLITSKVIAQLADRCNPAAIPVSAELQPAGY
jgi:hypothetical protein